MLRQLVNFIQVLHWRQSTVHQYESIWDEVRCHGAEQSLMTSDFYLFLTCQILSLGPNSHQMLLYNTCKPFKEIDISLFRMSVTRLIGKGRSESMRPLTASFESLWLTSELLQMTLASLTIRMMTAHTLKLQQQQNFPSSLT